MGSLRRFRTSMLVVLVAFTATAGVFAFARPEYRREYESEMIDFSTRDYLSPERVRHAFAAAGIRLERYGDAGGFVLMSNRSGRMTADELQVAVAPRRGRGSWGPVLEPYDERFDNVLVTYGGDDERLIERIDAAVDTLR